jgi:Flp pilus assembly protein TadG
MMIKNLLSSKAAKRAHKGQSLIELAISMVILLTLLAGIFDMGRAILAYFVLQDAAEEGMVYGTSFPTDCNQIDQRIRDNITNNIINENDMVISIYIQGDSGMMSCYSIPYAQVYATRLMRIEITADFHITMPFIGIFVGGNIIPLKVETNGVILRPPPPT